MEPPKNLDDFLDDIEPMTPEEQCEMLLRFASAEIGSHDSTLLILLCDHLLRTLPDNEHRQTLIEVIEGQIALRDIAKG